MIATTPGLPLLRNTCLHHRLISYCALSNGVSGKTIPVRPCVVSFNLRCVPRDVKVITHNTQRNHRSAIIAATGLSQQTNMTAPSPDNDTKRQFNASRRTPNSASASPIEQVSASASPLDDTTRSFEELMRERTRVSFLCALVFLCIFLKELVKFESFD
jgi:hypothetical protein